MTDSETTAAMRKIAGLLSHRPTIAVLHGQPVILTTLFLPQVEVIPPPESPEEVACFGPRRVDP